MMRLLATLSAVLLFAACSEKPQSATVRQADDKPWAGGSASFMASGYKAGADQATWEQQLKSRAQGQNEYNRAPAQK